MRNFRLARREEPSGGGSSGTGRAGPPRRRRAGRLLVALAMVAPGLAMAAEPVAAAPVVGTDVTYTTDADFDNGTLVNVNHDAPNNNQLQLNVNAGTFPFIWVALSQRCTIAKINTLTGTILGEYRTMADATPCTESSRTTVALDGSVWVGHRGPTGRVTKVGLVELNNCVDRNANGTIETSTGYGDVKAWPGNGAPVSAAEDECILVHVDTGGSDSRHMSVDAAGNLWVGDRSGGSIFRRYDGSTGALLAGPLDFNCGGYGGLIDQAGVIWSATSGGSILRYDTTQPLSGTNPRCITMNNYGMAIDSGGNIWVSTLGEGVVRKVSPDGNTITAYPQGVSNAQGLAVGPDDHVWISSSLFCGSNCTVAHLRPDGSLVGLVPTPTGSGSTGVSIDGAGKIWTANRSSNTAVRIDPTAGPVIGGTPLGAADLTVDFPAGPGGRPLPFPYNYSDMTGQQLFSSTSPQGTWTVVQDGGAAGHQWGRITWNTEPQGAVPPGTGLVVEARAADTEAGLGAQVYAAVANGTAFSLTGRFLQVRATLTPDAGGASPVLSDLRIQSAVSVAINDVTVTEGDAGLTPATFTLSLSQPAGPGGVSVLATTADGLAAPAATAPADYVAQAAIPVTFAPGTTTASFTVSVVGDLVDEPNETFVVNLSSPTNATIADGQGVGTIIDDDRNGTFSCRASALRVSGAFSAEPAVANPANAPCADGAATQVTANLAPGAVTVASRTLTATTDQTPDDLESAPASTADNAVAVAAVEQATVSSGPVNIAVTAVQSQARVRCTVGPGGGLVPSLTSSSTIASLTVNGIPVNANVTGTVALPLGLGSVAFNQVATTANSVTRTAVRIVLAGQTIVIAEARADYSGNPCAQ